MSEDTRILLRDQRMLPPPVAAAVYWITGAIGLSYAAYGKETVQAALTFVEVNRERIVNSAVEGYDVSKKVDGMTP